MKRAIYAVWLILSIFQFVITLKKNDKDLADRFIMVGGALMAFSAAVLLISSVVME